MQTRDNFRWWRSWWRCWGQPELDWSTLAERLPMHPSGTRAPPRRLPTPIPTKCRDPWAYAQAQQWQDALAELEGGPKTMKRAVTLLHSFLSAFLLASLAHADAPTLAAKTVAYVPNGTPDQVMDVFWTPGKPTATVLFIHGGSLQESGERRSSPEYARVCEPFVSAGIACASMDY